MTAEGTKTLTVRVSLGLRDRIDAARGNVARERWIREALESALGEAVSGDARGVPPSGEGSSPSPAPTRAPVALMAQQTAENLQGVMSARELMMRQRQERLEKERRGN